MSEICVHAISKTFRNAPAPAVDDVSFTVGQGEMLVLLGPSGCGKTTTLRCIAGLEQPTEGTITIGDTVVFDRDRRINVPSNKRDIGLVFQTFALWPHLSARENIAFPLTTRRVRKADRVRIVDDVARMVDLDAGLLEKRPAKLSGGQQQRVALARALVAEPTVVLFDEPLSNLDALLREQLRIDLRLLHKRIGFSGVYVTHDLTEGATIGDRVAVMRAGHMEQLGPSADVFEKPATSAVGRLLGLRQLCSLHQDQGRWRCGTNGNGADGLDFRGPAPIGSSPAAVDVFVRPDRLALHPEGTADAGGLTLHGGRVDECLYVGGGNELIVSLGRHRLRLARGRDERWTKGDRVVVEAPWTDVRFFTETGAVPGDALFDPDSVEVTA